MRPVDVAALRRSNLMYREPDLYDDFLDDETLDALAVPVHQFAPDAATAVDLGCGTGRTLAELCTRRRLTGVGVDVQAELVSRAHGHPWCEFVVADIRTVRLDRTFDVVLCLGNAAAYMLGDHDLTALLTTFAAHAHPGTLLLITTLLGDGAAIESNNVVNTRLGRAEVATRSLWNPHTRVQTTTRRWEFADGRVEQDSMWRRRPTDHELTTGLTHAGFHVLDIADGQAPITVVARYRH
jgi:trans-aconitate methyltransferase